MREATTREGAFFRNASMRAASFAAVHVPDIRATQRRSLAGRVSHRVVNGLSFADLDFEEPRTGTVTGTTINSLCSIIGAGVLSLPLALYYSSILVGLAILALLSSCAAFSVYCLVVGCDATGRYSITEVVAFALFPPQLWEDYLASKGLETVQASPTLADHSVHRGDFTNRNGQGSGRSNGGHHAQQQSIGQGLQSTAGGAAPPSYVSSSTTAYDEMRDTYARHEWHKRRWRRWVTMVMEFIVFCSNYGTLIVYSKVIADSMPPVVAYVTNSEGIFTTEDFWLVAGGVVFFVLSCARNMEELKWTSLLGFLTILYIVVIIVYRFHTKHTRDYPHVSPSKHGSIHWLSFSVTVLQTVSTFGMAFSYHYNVPYMYKEMEDRQPHNMMRSTAIAFPIVVACYAVTGVVGYLTFGNLVASRKVGGNIVSNYPESDLLMNIGRLGLFAHFACVFPIVSICTRRGMHRLTMIALTWVEQSALMREAAKTAGAVLTASEDPDVAANERARARATAAGAGHSGKSSPTPDVGETSPLLRGNGGRPVGYEGSAGGASAAGTDAVARMVTPNAGHHVSFSSSATTLDDHDRAGYGNQSGDGTIDVDRDVGAPDLTTNLAIVIEAAILVTTTVALAGTVSGIDFVINIIGTLFSVFIVMVAPGMVGWCVFSPNGPFGSATAAAAEYGGLRNSLGTDGASDGNLSGASSRYRFIRLKQVLCLVNAILGFCITVIGITVLITNTVRNKPSPLTQLTE